MRTGLPLLLGMLVMTVPGVRTLATTPDPYVILDKHVAGIGGWAVLDAARTTHSRGTLEFEGAGLKGTVENWSQMPDKSRQDLDVKVMRETSGDNGQYAWRVDQNNKLQIKRDAASLKERQLDQLMAKREHLKRGSKVFTVTYDRMDTVNDSTCHVIKTTNTINSFVFHDFYDTTSYRLIKSTVIKPEGETQTVYSDFRKVGGMLVPFETRQLSLPTNQQITVKLASFEVNSPIDPALFEPPSKQKRDYRFPAGKDRIEVPFKFMELNIFLPLTINGKTRLWILDSGASITVVEPEFAKELGLELTGQLTGQGATHTVAMAFTTLPPFELNGLAFDSQKVGSTGISEIIRKTMGLEIGGVLGYDFLSRLVTKIDYAHEMLTFYDPESFRYTGDGVVLDAPITENGFQVEIAVDGQYRGMWAVDLGATGLDFYYPYAEAHNLLNRAGVTRIAFGAGGDRKCKMTKFGKVEFAGFTVPDLLVKIPSVKGKGAFSRGETTGNAGNDLFRHFNLYLDYAWEKVIVEKGADFDKVFPVDHSGLQIWLGEDGQLAVLMAAPGTSAEKAGLQKDDKITSINGKSPADLGGIVKIRELLKGPIGTTFKIDFVRSGKPLSAAMTLKDLFE